MRPDDDIICGYIESRIQLQEELQKQNPLAADALNYGNDLQKILIISIASRYEAVIIQDILGYFKSHIDHEPGLEFIEKKALSRSYYQLFDWTKGEKGVKQFFKLYGEQCLSFYEEQCRLHDWLSSGARDFIYIGAERNKIVHNDFITCSLPDITTLEIIEKHHRAMQFVNAILGLINQEPLM